MEGLYPLEDLSLKDLARKTAMLLALCTAHRAQTLTCIKINNILNSTDKIEIKIPDLIKTSGPGRFQPFMVFSSFNEKPELCLVKALRKYLEVTEKIRGNIQQLFITTKKPYKAINSQTFDHWIKSVLKESKIDTSIFSAHLTRHASTSKAFSKGVNLTTIKRTAGWSENSQVFAKFYNRPIRSVENYANIVLSKKKRYFID